MAELTSVGWPCWARTLVLTCSLFAWCGSLAAQSEDVTEHSIKAAFLFKFGGYVDWPVDAFADNDSPLVIGVFGAEAVAVYLVGMVVNRNINGRSVEVRRLRSGESPAGVHVLFVGREVNSDLQAIMESVADRPVLVVTETDDAGFRGIINFVVVNNKVRFDVMLASAEARNLKISARLLGVARNVTDGSS